MDSGPKHTSHSTSRFIFVNNINYCPTPPQSPDLIPIEMVWNDLKFNFGSIVSKLKNQADLVREINKWWLTKLEDLEYCKKKFDHLQRVIDMIIALCGRATGM